MKRSLRVPSSASTNCSSSPVPSVATTSACVSPRVNSAEPWVRGSTPTWTEIGILFTVAFFATLGHYTMTLAFAAAPMTVTQPVTFLQLVWSVAVGAAFFGEPVDVWVVAGGLSYTLGAVFYAAKKLPFNHAIWHLFVLAGGFCHFVAVAEYVLPVARAPVILSCIARFPE